MARTTAQLTATQVKNAKPKAGKAVKLFDGQGLFLLVSAKGTKGWRFKFRLHGIEKLMSFGNFPEISLADAREMRTRARTLVAKDIDPIHYKAEQKRQAKEEYETTFEKVATDWIAKQGTLAASTIKMINSRLAKDINPKIGKFPIKSITPKQALDLVIRPMENRGAVVLSRRAKSIMSQVFCYAVAEGYIERDPTVDIVKSLKKVERGNRAAVTDPKQLGPLLRAIDDYEGSHIVKCALQLLPLLFVRPGELRAMRWQDVDCEVAEWRFVAPKTKKEMIVPLASQSLAILEALYPLTGELELCFPSIRTVAKPISDVTLNASFRRMGFDKDTVTAHGFRATFRTIADEVLQQRYDLIEHQLGHVVKDPNGTAYNRTKFLPQRHKMMQVWADYLDELKIG